MDNTPYMSKSCIHFSFLKSFSADLQKLCKKLTPNFNENLFIFRCFLTLFFDPKTIEFSRFQQLLSKVCIFSKKFQKFTFNFKIFGNFLQLNLKIPLQAFIDFIKNQNIAQIFLKSLSPGKPKNQKCMFLIHKTYVFH